MSTPTKTKRKRGRPSSYTTELGAQICERIAMREPLSKIVAEQGMPHKRTIYQWQIKHEDFAKNLQRAREHRAEARSNYIDDIVEQVRIGKLDANSANVMINAEKWQASKENPRRYADRVELTGKDGGPVSVAVNDDAVLIRTARWVADLLSRANEAPPTAIAATLGLPAPTKRNGTEQS